MTSNSEHFFERPRHEVVGCRPRGPTVPRETFLALPVENSGCDQMQAIATLLAQQTDIL
jgi:hypothetical protein